MIDFLPSRFTTEQPIALPSAIPSVIHVFAHADANDTTKALIGSIELSPSGQWLMASSITRAEQRFSVNALEGAIEFCCDRYRKFAEGRQGMSAEDGRSDVGRDAA